MGFKEDLFILASQALQKFYVEDTIEKDWHVVVRMQSRDLFDVLVDSEAIDDYAMPNLDDQIFDHENFHTRVGVEETLFPNYYRCLPSLLAMPMSTTTQ